MNDNAKTDQLFSEQIRSFHLFAGAGGGILGDVLIGHRPIGAVEWNPHCRSILEQRQRDGCLPWFPIFDNVKEFDGSPWKGLVDILAGGFPCQPFSTAGKKRKQADERNLWPETLRIIREVGSPVAFLENVPGLVACDYFGQIIGQLGEIGFDAEWDVVSAAMLGASHVRSRLWILAWDRNRVVANSNRNGDVEYVGISSIFDRGGRDRTGGQRKWGEGGMAIELVSGVLAPEKWKSKGQQIDPRPIFVRSDDGMADGLDRLKAIGNGQVPCVAAFAMQMLAARVGIDLSQLWKLRTARN